MFRFLLWLGLGYLFLRLFIKRPAVDKQNPATGSPGAGRGEKMVKCAVCGLYVPEHEALAGGWRRDAGHYYCSPECRQKGV
ncbi:MAG: hypothetical protein JXR80_04575 [Deltaproteobacteria bacterium]|nr:hypothetical protein [Deltaproteobacteria bacterium]